LEVPDIVVGHIISEYLDFLVNNLNTNKAILKYFQLANTYYQLALDYGELILLDLKEFINTFLKLGKSPTTYKTKLGIMSLLAELSNAKILEKRKSQNIIGQEALFEKVIPYHDKLAETYIEIKY